MFSANGKGQAHLRPCAACGLQILVEAVDGALNSRKAPGLGFALLQFFVDHVQRLMSRADSCLLMSKARELRAALAHEGWPETDLP